MQHRQAAIHICVLVAFGVAQPLYDLLGRNGDFFVAHRMDALDLVAFAAALSLGLPGVLVALYLGCVRMHRAAGAAVLNGLVFLLVSLIALGLVRSAEPLSGVAGIAGSIAAAVALTAVYRTSERVRVYLVWLSPAILVFPLYFLLWGPASQLTDAGAPAGDFDSVAAQPAPIVFLLFDEFNVSALLDEQGQIDRLRFPHFAALAESAWWFPDAAAIGLVTPVVVPAMLTGRLRSGKSRPATASNYRDNLFTRIAPQYALRVQEDITYLCPEELCPRQSFLGRQFQPRLFVSDLAIVYVHLLLANRHTEGWLPPVDMAWKGFRGLPAEAEAPPLPNPQKSASGAPAGGSDPDETPAGGRAGQFQKLVDSMLAVRPSKFQRFIDEIEPTSDPVLHFLHLLLPHEPYDYLPDGQRYNSGPTPGQLWERVGHPSPAGLKLPKVHGIAKGKTFVAWADNPALIQVAYHRYLYQVAYADALLGQLLNKLEEAGLYERSLIIVTADHGIAFRPGHPKRFLTRANAPDILQIPMFVKLPGQKIGRTSLRHVSGLDILPTIADTIGLSPPWDGPGQSMVAEGFSDPPRIRIATRVSGILSFEPEVLRTSSRLPWQVETFGTGIPMERVAAKGPFTRLVGQRVSEISGTVAEDELRVVTKFFALLEGQDQPGWLLPVILYGRIEGAGADELPIALAIAVNGVVVATTATTTIADESGGILAVLPPAAFDGSPNTVALYHIHADAPDEASSSQQGSTGISLHLLADGSSSGR